MAHIHKSNWELIKNGIFAENTIFRMAISLCPSIAVTNSLKNGFSMGVSVIFVQVMVNLTVSLIRNFVNPKIRIPIFMMVIAGYVSIIDMTMAAFARPVYKQLGLYIQLIMVLPAGGFFAVGLLMGFFNWVDMKLSKEKG